MSRITITKEFIFHAAHMLPWHQGKCKELHGHTYKLQVTVFGEMRSEGIIVDFGDLSKMVNEAVINRLDHIYLNDVIDNPTAERIVQWVVDRLNEEFDALTAFNLTDLQLVSVRLWETPTSYVEWSNE